MPAGIRRSPSAVPSVASNLPPDQSAPAESAVATAVKPCKGYGLLTGSEHARGDRLLRIYGVLEAFVRPRVRPDDVRNVVQETLARALAKGRRFANLHESHTWLCGIARKVICELRRQERSRPRGDFANLGLSHPESHEPQPHASAEAAETLQAIRETLERLPPKSRQLLVWHCEEKRTVDQIASLLGIGVRAVRSRIHRARALFATEWRRRGRSEIAPAT